MKIIFTFSFLGLMSGAVSSYLLFIVFSSESSGGSMIMWFLPCIVFSVAMTSSFLLLSDIFIGSSKYKTNLLYFNFSIILGYILTVFSIAMYSPLLPGSSSESNFLYLAIFLGGLFIVSGLFRLLSNINIYQLILSVLLIVGSGFIGYQFFSNPDHPSPYMIFIFWQSYVAVIIGAIVNEWDKNKKISSNLNQNG